jgi:hypothetical protein
VKSIKITEDYLQYQQKLLNSIHSWKDKASCHKVSFKNEDFFDTSEPALKLLSKKYCKSCPVQQHCLYTSLVTNEIYGLWGGLTPKQRRIYYKYILINAQERGLNISHWSKDLDEHFQSYSDSQKIKEVFPLN